MTNLLHTEWLKMYKYRAFWWMAAIIALSYPGINYLFYNVYAEITKNNDEKAMLVKMLITNPFTFPEVWHTVAFFSSFFVFIPAVIIIMFITNEYTYKTHRQNIIDGWSRNQFMTSKMIDVTIISVLVTLLYIIVSLIIGFINQGNTTANIWEGSKYIGLFALLTFSQLSIAFLIAFLVRKAFIALGIFLFYFIMLERIAVEYAKWKLNDIGRFFPLEISDRLVPVPAFLGKFDEKAYNESLANINTHVFMTVVLTAIIWLICFQINKKRDL